MPDNNRTRALEISRLFNDGQVQFDQFTAYRANRHVTNCSYYTETAEQRLWSPTQWHLLHLQLAKLINNPGGHRTLELYELDAASMTPETGWLFKHTMLASPPPLPLRHDRYDRMLALFPGLRPLADIARSDVRLPIVLAEAPRGVYPYFTEQSILL